MLDVPTTTPLSPAIAAMSVQERMLAVVRRINPHGDPESGPSVTIEDFQQAEETCDLTDSQISVNIGAVKRLARQAATETVEPVAPAKPWDLYPDYRKQRVADAAAHLAGMIPSETDRFALLRACQFEADELGDLWDEIHAETLRLFDAQHTGLMARIIVELSRAQDAFDAAAGNDSASARELVRSMSAVLHALDGQHELPKSHVLQTVRTLVSELERSNVDRRIVDNARTASVALADLWGL